jgi:membrane protein implicated in regulation of membrane protease activity
MYLYQWYVIISAILIVLEIFAPGFVLLPIGIAGLFTAVVAYFRPELWLHAVFFICGSGIALIALSKFRDSMNTKIPKENVGPVGQTGVIVAHEGDSRTLKVKVFGDIWDILESSVPAENGSMFPPGSRVRVTSISGNKVAVEKIQEG